MIAGFGKMVGLLDGVAPPARVVDSWDFNYLLTYRADLRIRNFFALVDDLLSNTVLKDELTELIENDMVHMKERSHEGLVWRHGRGTDLGNYKYGLLYCTLVRVSRERCPDVSNLFAAMERLDNRLAIRSNRRTCIVAKGDVIECVLARSRYTGTSVPIELHADRFAMQATFQAMDDCIDDLYRCAWRGDSHPFYRDLPWVHHLSAMVLVASSVTSPAPPPRWRAVFDSLVRNAFRL